MASLLVVRPANDPPAIELSNWCSGLLSTMTASHTILRDLYAGSATRILVDATMIHGGTRCLLFFGHGRDAELMGATGSLIDTANIGMAKGAIVVSIACSSAKVMGPDAVHQGVTAFLGFKDRLVWISRDPEHQFEPAMMAGIQKLVVGDDVDAARQEMHDRLETVIDYYLNGAGRRSPNSAYGWLMAFWNQQRLELLGNGWATL